MIPKSNILCIFEGERREGLYFKTIKNLFFSEHSIVTCCYGNDIYELFKEMRDDPDLDIVEVLRDSIKGKDNSKILKEYDREQFSQVFLFFDAECHDQKFDKEELLSIIKVFNEETESGKIFISYPMVEAIRDIPSHEEYISHKVNLSDCTGKIYKNSSTNGLKTFIDPRHNELSDWMELIKLNVTKSNFIVSGEKNNAKTIPEQLDIAEYQIKSIEKDNSIYVLSAYPLFIFHQKSSNLNFI
ncbi:hypothetical protein [Shewanella decolorationis]|uniref:hypothetical protein n=1 Tax=Shewanella decolorationis TaxID=256839 RepID=UPI001057598B|nr:hypothetical protein [Shewanella decolorationis]